MKIKVYAKLNLALNVLSLENEGYHQLDMVNQSIDLFDEIELTPRQDGVCKVRCDKDIGVINTALTSASEFIKRFDCCGYDIYVKKGIPMMGGLGGSSADAAGILSALSKLHCADMDEVYKIADEVGSDVRYMMTGGLARVQGKGELVSTAECDSVLYFVVVIPPYGLSTRKVFETFDANPDFTCADNAKLIAAVADEDVAAVKMNMYNGLQKTAFALDGRLKKLFDRVSERGFAQMTGSGSCLFLVSDSRVECDFAAERLRKEGINAVAVESKNYGVEFL